MTSESRKRGKSTADRRLQARERERQAVALRREGLPYDEIAAELGFAGESGAREAVKRALARVTDAEVESLREVESNRINDLMRRLYRELERDHFVVQWGKIVRHADGTPVHDSGAVVAIIREIRQLSAVMSRLHGLHAPMRTVVEEITEDAVQAEIRRITALAEKVEADLEASGAPSPEEPEP